MVATNRRRSQGDTGRRLVIASSTPTVTRKRKLKTGSIELSERQHEVLCALREFVRMHGIAPTHAEIREAIGISESSPVFRHLHALAHKGWIELKPGVERGIVLLREGAPLYESEQLQAMPPGPRLRGARAPEPSWIDCEQLQTSFEMEPDLFLRISGDTTEEVGLHDRDIVAVRREAEPGNGDIVAARIGEEVTLMRFMRSEDTTARLQTVSRDANEEAINLRRSTEDVEIIGVVVGAIVGTRRTTRT